MIPIMYPSYVSMSYKSERACVLSFGSGDGRATGNAAIEVMRLLAFADARGLLKQAELNCLQCL